MFRTLFRAVLAVAVLTGAVAAQTAGVPGTNDLIVNGNGSGGTSCITTSMLAPSLVMTELTALPNSPVIGLIANSCAAGTFPINSTYSLDLDLPSLDFIFDGTGGLAPGPLTPFAQTDIVGYFAFGVTIPNPVSIGLQMAIVNPGYQGGLATSQAHEVLLLAAQCPPLGPAITQWSAGGTSNDDAWYQFPFTAGNQFTFYGTPYSECFIGTNGFLTFVSGDTAFSESDAAMSSGPPRIAAVWDDLSPQVNGGVYLHEDLVGNEIVVTWHNVPHYPSLGSTSACIHMDLASGQITLLYDECTAHNGTVLATTCLVGISPGVDPAGVPCSFDLVDLSPAVPGGTFATAPMYGMWESFNQGTPVIPATIWDLDFTVITFIDTGAGQYLQN